MKKLSEENKFGKLIRRKRMEQGLTGVAFARLLCLRAQAITEIERGTRVPLLTDEKIAMIAAALDIDIELLLHLRATQWPDYDFNNIKQYKRRRNF